MTHVLVYSDAVIPVQLLHSALTAHFCTHTVSNTALFLYLIVKSEYFHTHALCEKFPSSLQLRLVQLFPSLLEIRVGELQSHVFKSPTFPGHVTNTWRNVVRHHVRGDVTGLEDSTVQTINQRNKHTSKWMNK